MFSRSPRLLPTFTRTFLRKIGKSNWDRKIGYAMLGRCIAELGRTASIDRAVLWNGLPSRHAVPPQGELIFYDHGSSSIQKPSSANRALLRLASRIVAISEANIFLLRERWDWHGEIARVANPLRSAIAEVPLDSPRRPIVDGRWTVGMAARLIPLKGIVSGIHAVALLRSRGTEVDLRIAGDGPEEKNLKQIAEELGIAEHVHFEGQVQNMSDYFSSIDVFVAPSLREPSGLSPLEAIASGTPTILSAVDGHLDILPFAEAAKVIEPTLRLSEYARLGSSLQRIPKFVYSPIHRAIVQTRALDPAALAESLLALFERYEEESATAFHAGLQIRMKNSMATYVADLTRAIQG